MEKIFEFVNRERVFDKELCDKAKLLLVPIEWRNDNGYYVRYQLFDGVKRIKLADICILNLKQKVGEVTDFSKPFLTFITNIESAYFLFLFLNPNERRTLSEQLNFTYDNKKVCNDKCYTQGVLRDINGMDYLRTLAKIKEIMTSPLDVTSTIHGANKQVIMMLADENSVFD